MILNYFKFFSNCFLVDGFNRSLIVDIQRNNFVAIPDSMSVIIKMFNEKKSISEIKSEFESDNLVIIDEYLHFLIENEYGFMTSFEEYDLFPSMNSKFESPDIISNCIIELSEITFKEINKIINSLENLFCKNIQIISYNSLDIEILKKILISIKDSDFKSIELILPFSNELIQLIDEIDKINFRITNILIHNTSQTYNFNNKKSFGISFIEEEIISFKNCGKISNYYFNVNKEKVLESFNHNSCLNKKISIDKNGNIKNCPAISQNFGNIKDTTLEEALNYKDFKKYWNITKDQIDVCKDCEFRHICTDCRAYVEDPENQYSKPLKCGYSPYTNEWEEWSTNPLKQKAIKYYGMKDLEKK